MSAVSNSQYKPVRSLELRMIDSRSTLFLTQFVYILFRLRRLKPVSLKWKTGHVHTAVLIYLLRLHPSIGGDGKKERGVILFLYSCLLQGGFRKYTTKFAYKMCPLVISGMLQDQNFHCLEAQTILCACSLLNSLVMQTRLLTNLGSRQSP